MTNGFIHQTHHTPVCKWLAFIWSLVTLQITNYQLSRALFLLGVPQLRISKDISIIDSFYLFPNHKRFWHLKIWYSIFLLWKIWNFGKQICYKNSCLKIDMNWSTPWIRHYSRVMKVFKFLSWIEFFIDFYQILKSNPRIILFSHYLQIKVSFFLK